MRALLQGLVLGVVAAAAGPGQVPLVGRTLRVATVQHPLVRAELNEGRAIAPVTVRTGDAGPSVRRVPPLAQVELLRLFEFLRRVTVGARILGPGAGRERGHRQQENRGANGTHARQTTNAGRSRRGVHSQRRSFPTEGRFEKHIAFDAVRNRRQLQPVVVERYLAIPVPVACDPARPLHDQTHHLRLHSRRRYEFHRQDRRGAPANRSEVRRPPWAGSGGPSCPCNQTPLPSSRTRRSPCWTSPVAELN